jgi:hypothetical protein
MFEIRKTGRTWSIFRNGDLIEGGFFRREAAVEAAKQYQREWHGS